MAYRDYDDYRSERNNDRNFRRRERWPSDSYDLGDEGRRDRSYDDSPRRFDDEYRSDRDRWQYDQRWNDEYGSYDHDGRRFDQSGDFDRSRNLRNSRGYDEDLRGRGQWDPNENRERRSGGRREFNDDHRRRMDRSRRDEQDWDQYNQPSSYGRRQNRGIGYYGQGY